MGRFSRLEKVGTIYSRILGFQKTGAADYDKRPLWFDVYQAFPPKYEPRWDRHVLNYGAGSNVAAMGKPTKILYREDTVRAQFYKVFFAEDLAKQDQTRIKERFPPIYNETFNLIENKETMSQMFIQKHDEVSSQYKDQPEVNLFKATVEALELDGIHLLNPEKSGVTETVEEQEISSEVDKGISRRLSLKEIFALEKEKNKDSENT